jgi:hypothetical protein
VIESGRDEANTTSGGDRGTRVDDVRAARRDERPSKLERSAWTCRTTVLFVSRPLLGFSGISHTAHRVDRTNHLRRRRRRHHREYPVEAYAEEVKTKHVYEIRPAKIIAASI